MKLIGKELKSWREAAGFSQDDLAAELNRSRSCISKFENDHKNIDIYTFVDWVRATNAELQAATVMFGAELFTQAANLATLIPAFITPVIQLF